MERDAAKQTGLDDEQRMSRVGICVEWVEVNRLSIGISSLVYGDVWSYRPRNQGCILRDRYVNVDNANGAAIAFAVVIASGRDRTMVLYK